MNNIQKGIEKNKYTMRVGACIQFETYLEMIDLVFKTFKFKIEENSELFDDNISSGEFFRQFDILQEQISFFVMLVQKEIEKRKFDSCDYFIKYNN